MKKKVLIFLVAVATPLLCETYLSNKSCNECHPDIYNEYQASWHAKTWFNDTFHKKVAGKIPVYDCGRCHMPSADNLRAMEEGKTRPNPIHKRQKDAISCFYCHTIAYVKAAHRFNEIQSARQAEGYKPTLYGSLENPDDSDKHAMVRSPIYERYACLGCHGHKRNSYGVLIFRTVEGTDGSKKCIECHMPMVSGGPEKMNKRSRLEHHSHRFPGIHSASMRQKSVDISIVPEGDTLSVRLKNKMGHPLIIQPGRMKYLHITLLRDGKKIWENFADNPREDTQACFVTDFVDDDGKPVAIPYFAKKRGFVNNLEAYKEKTLRYKVPSLHKNDRIVVEMFVIPAKPSCARAIGLDEKSFTRPILMKRVETNVR